MANNLKSDIIDGAYSQMRISGITVDPGASDLVLALRRLDGLASELCGRKVYTGYYFEEEPDITSPSGIDRKYWYSFECILAMRLLSDFGKGMKPDPMLEKMHLLKCRSFSHLPRGRDKSSILAGNLLDLATNIRSVSSLPRQRWHLILV